MLLVLILVSGCSTSPFYQASDVSRELKKNSNQLQVVTMNTIYDFQDKEAFYKNYLETSKNKDSFIIQDLAWRLSDMRNKKDSILRKSAFIKEVNDHLLNQLSKKNKVNATDPVFKKIEAFAKVTKPEANILFKEFESYKNASTEFARFALFTGNIWKKSTER